jgi:transcriptional regulator with XRE-family HTH domain
MLGEVLRKKGIKQNYLASEIGVSVVTVSNWVKGKSTPREKNLEMICEVLGVSKKQLIQ